MEKKTKNPEKNVAAEKTIKSGAAEDKKEKNAVTTKDLTITIKSMKKPM